MRLPAYETCSLGGMVACYLKGQGPHWPLSVPDLVGKGGLWCPWDSFGCALQNCPGVTQGPTLEGCWVGETGFCRGLGAAGLLGWSVPFPGNFRAWRCVSSDAVKWGQGLQRTHRSPMSSQAPGR